MLVLAVVPMLVMLVPVSLLLGQLALWYQSRPLRGGEETVVSVKLGGEGELAGHAVSIEPTPAIEVVTGPVRVLSQREVWWTIKARQSGYHRILLRADGCAVEKELAVGDAFMRLSPTRPGWSWTDILLHPCEPPLEPESPIQSIKIDYPDRLSWTSGTDWWVVYWLVVSMVGALGLRPFMKVNL